MVQGCMVYTELALRWQLFHVVLYQPYQDCKYATSVDIQKLRQVWNVCKLECHATRLICCLHCQGYTEGSKCNLCTIFSELLVLLHPNWIWWSFIKSLVHLVKRLYCCAQVKSPAKVKNVSEYSSGQYLLNNSTFCDQTLHHPKPECPAKRWVAITKVKVPVKARVIRLWLFQLYLLNCWSFCKQT